MRMMRLHGAPTAIRRQHARAEQQHKHELSPRPSRAARLAESLKSAHKEAVCAVVLRSSIGSMGPQPAVSQLGVHLEPVQAQRSRI